MTDNRCVNCDRPLANVDEFHSIPGGEGEHLCWSEYGTKCEPEDWRERALKAEAELAKLREPLKLQDGECVDLDKVTVYTRRWCDGNGNLGPCMCADDDNVGRGHWRSGRSVPLASVLNTFVERQREACAESALKWSRGQDEVAEDKERDSAFYSAETHREEALMARRISNSIRTTPLVTEEKPCR